MPFPFTNPFDNTFPPDTQLANQLGNDIRTLKLDLQQRMSAISGNSVSSTQFPNFVNDTQPTAWGTPSGGVLFFATDTGRVWQWTGSTTTPNTTQGWLDVSDTIGGPTGIFTWNAGNFPNGYQVPAGQTVYLGVNRFVVDTEQNVQVFMVMGVNGNAIIRECLVDIGGAAQPSGTLTISLRLNGSTVSPALATVTPATGSSVRIPTYPNLQITEQAILSIIAQNTGTGLSASISSFGMYFG